MGMDIHVYLEKYNPGAGRWEAIVPIYRRDNIGPFKEAVLYFWRNRDLFAILDGKEAFSPHNGIPKDASNYVRAKAKEAFPEDKHYTGYFNPHYATLADMQVYYLAHKKVLDYDADWGENGESPKYMKNPIKHFINRMGVLAETCGEVWDWEDEKSEIRVVYWFDN